MDTPDDIIMQMADLDVDNEENEELVLEDGVEEDANKFELCLVGRFLTEKNINVRAMRSKMADVWKPAMGVNIKVLKDGIFLFQFYHIDDMQWVLKGGPWSFDNALLVINTIKAGENPVTVPLNEVDFWIQIHGLPVGYMSEIVGKQLGNFFGTFLQYDAKNNSSIWRDCMRLRIRVDVRRPLKRKKKICKKDKTEVMVHVKYERLPDFCFTCGLLSHTERFCKKKLENNSGEVSKDWGSWLRAPPRRVGGASKSKWLREEGDGEWGQKYGMDNYQQQSREVPIPNIPQTGTQSGKQKDIVIGFANISGGSDKASKNSKNMGGNFKPITTVGPDEEELDGLNLEERKRRRSEAHGYTSNLVIDENTTMETGLSTNDCSDSLNQQTATLAQQASRQQ